ncbi:unnamed protein product [Blepharisma stoltei]|uniref:Kinesin motor domain-containing protein n=1 Tax=Blepharisma stoltei TaxID=1481888 RepID=A0AAU9JCH8_9CILI|nr:unnamed protein product [Blepharisma stoltei]
MSEREAELESQLLSLQQEFEEFQAQSKEYEEILEAEVAEKDEKIHKISRKLEDIEDELKDYKEKYKKNEHELTKKCEEVDKLKRQLKSHEDQKRELEHLNDQWEQSARILEFSKQDLEEKLYQAEENAILYKEELDEITVSKEIELQRLRDECKELKQEISTLVAQHGDTNKILELEIALEKATKQQENYNLKLENAKSSLPSSRFSSRRVSADTTIPALSEGNHMLKVIVRVRPILELDSSKASCIICDNNTLFLSMPTSRTRGRVSVNSQKKYEFSKIFDQKSTISEVFQEAYDCIEHASFGGRSCIIAYGQTGSGKTYTMNGIIEQSFYALKKLLENENIKVTMHCIEIYNEQVRNLLTDLPLSKNWNDIVSIAEIELQNDWVSHGLSLIDQTLKRRATRQTSSNEFSSRSHLIYTLKIMSGRDTGIIQFVDLAGSERLIKSSVTGEMLKETLLINKSLSALQDVIGALESKQNHVPFRNSILTRILQPTLGGSESKITFILNCSPSESCSNETASTLALGLRLQVLDFGFLIRKNLNCEEIERTLKLLEKERAEKNTISRRLDKVERDLESYQYALKDREVKMGILNTKYKQKEKTFQDEITKLKKELVNLKVQQDETNKRLKTIAAKAENENIFKSKAAQLSRNKDEHVKRKGSISPSALTRPSSNPPEDVRYQKSQTPSRIPQPKLSFIISANSIKDNQLVS